MPISVLCPSCSATVTAPDSAAGRKAQCPKCQSLMLLPGEAVAPAPPAPEPDYAGDDVRPSRRRSRRRDDDEDDRPSRRRDDDEDDRPSSRRYEEDDEDDRPSRRRRREEDDEDDYRPRRSSRKRKQSSNAPALIVGGVGLAVVATLGLLVWWLIGKQPANNFPGANNFNGNNAAPAFAGPKAAIPPGWVMFNEPGGRFTTAMPVQPMPIPVPMVNPIADEIKLWQAQTNDGQLYQALFQSFRTLPPGDPPPAFLDQACDQFSREVLPTFGAEVSRADSTLGGFRAKEMKFTGPFTSATVRLAFANRKMFAASVVSRGGQPDAANARAYFDNFQPK